MKRATSIASAILAIAVAASAGAQPAADQARTDAQARAASAKTHFDRGEYADAVADYREAYRLWPSAGVLFNLGQALRLAGDCADAARAYRDYLRLVPDTPYRATVEQNLAAAETCAKPEPSPVAQPPAPAPAAPSTIVPPAPAPIAPSDDDRGHLRRPIGVALVAGGAVLVAGGAYFAVDALHAQREVADFYAHGGAWSDIASTDARGHRAQALSIAGFAAGGAALAAGALLYVTGRRAERAVAIAPMPGGGEVVLAWRF